MNILLVGLAGLVVVALASGYAISLARRLDKRMSAALGDSGSGALEQTLRDYLERVEAVDQKLDRLTASYNRLTGLAGLASQKISVVRFNPFADTGGDQSFAVALLDAEGNGVVLSSLHGRADTRIFAKAVQAGRSKHALSDEEQDAIRKALSPAGA